MKKYIEILLSIPKSFVLNLLIFGLRGGYIPILFHYRTKVKGIHKNCIVLKGTPKPFSIRYGFGGSQGVPHSTNKSYFILGKKGLVIFKGGACFGSGSTIRCDGTLSFGERFSANKNCFFSCYQKIEFGNDVLLGWECCIRDSDGHYMLRNSVKKDLNADVIIGNHVWICSYVHILKGVSIGNDSVIAYKSLVTKSFMDSNCLLGGHPAKIIDDSISWGTVKYFSQIHFSGE